MTPPFPLYNQIIGEKHQEILAEGSHNQAQINVEVIVPLVLAAFVLHTSALMKYL